MQNNKIYHTVSLYPECFSYDFINQNIMTRSSNLQSILSFIVDRGILFQITQDWNKYVKEFIEKYSEIDYKKTIEETLETLDKRNRIHSCPKKIKLDFDCWHKEIKNHELDLYFATKTKEPVHSIDNVNKKIQKDSGAIINTQNEEFIENILSSILPYSQKVTIIDPYFTVTNKKHHIPLLKIIFTQLINRCTTKHNSTIEIHTSVKHSDYDKTNWENNWQKQIKFFENNSNHRVIIVVWKEKDNNRFHDRYLLTDIGGFNLGKGADIAPDSEYTWSHLHYGHISKLLSKVDKNNPNSYQFICEITSSEIKKLTQNKKYSLQEIAKELNMSIDDFINKANASNLLLMPTFSKDMRPLSQRQYERIVEKIKNQ